MNSKIISENKNLIWGAYMVMMALLFVYVSDQNSFDKQMERFEEACVPWCTGYDSEVYIEDHCNESQPYIDVVCACKYSGTPWISRSTAIRYACK